LVFLAGSILSSSKASLIAAGGVLGAEGGAYYMAESTADDLVKLRQIINTVKSDKSFW